jgi:excisionase family DNA binding protein
VVLTTLVEYRFNRDFNETYTHYPKPFYSLPEAAQLLGLHYSTLWAWIKDGRLQAAKLPSHKRSRIRVPAAELVRLLNVSPLRKDKRQ